jgi:predicted nucleic acid-binding protein
VLVDTSAWIELFRATGSATDARLAAAFRRGDAIAVTGVVLQEVLQGCRDQPQVTAARTLLSGLVVAEAVFPATYEHAAALYRRCRAAGRTVRGTVDCLVAAVALEHRLPLLACDRDFVTLRDVCGLTLVTV